jgi:hypothetical protein
MGCASFVETCRAQRAEAHDSTSDFQLILPHIFWNTRVTIIREEKLLEKSNLDLENTRTGALIMLPEA